MPRRIQTLLEGRLATYRTTSDQQIVHAAKEIIQELALLGLSRQGFFKKAAFHGGTALRLFYGLRRFSEDLDFCLLEPDETFTLSDLLGPLTEELRYWGLSVEIVAGTQLPNNVRKAMIKESSLAAELVLATPLAQNQKLRVKVELDVSPPNGAKSEAKLCEFPTDYYVTAHDESTLFSGKIHALLCRPFAKGRDWFDLGFYIARRSTINLVWLRNALQQVGPYSGTELPQALTVDWVGKQLRDLSSRSDFDQLRRDVSPFVEDVSDISLWSDSFFQDKLDALVGSK